MKFRHAFTLVELLVVIAIIGLLSTIAIVSLTSARSKARDTKRLADIHQITTAMQLYRQDNGNYPDPGALGCTGGSTAYYCLGHGDGGSCWPGIPYHGCTALDNAMSPYIAKIPDDPENNTSYWGDAYVYLYSGSNSGVVAPFIHWGMDQQTNSTICNGGVAGQWGAPGRNRWYCLTALPL
jgi:prepilin-type N-terminal cleavage/methylation domain-containing protein